MSARSKCLLVWAIVVATGYVAVSAIAYQFRHPDQTDTQRFLNIWEAMTWKK